MLIMQQLQCLQYRKVNKKAYQSNKLKQKLFFRSFSPIYKRIDFVTT